MNSDSKSQTDPQFVPGSRLTVPAEKFWQIAQNKLLIDVRSPGEFAEDHIPGAINIPLFENEERAEIGTLYQKSGHDEAVLRGLEIVGPKMRQLVSAVEKANTVNTFWHLMTGAWVRCPHFSYTKHKRAQWEHAPKTTRPRC
jgi:rhodanese-related sulfurtransferase